MSAYKKLNSQDAYITTYTAQKHWAVSGSEYEEYGITKLAGESGSGAYYKNLNDYQLGQYRRLVYNSIDQLYYSNYSNGEILVTGSFDNYEQSSFNISGSRTINSSISVFSIPRNIIGTHMEPGTFRMIISGSSADDYMSSSYSRQSGYDDYVETFSSLLTLYGTIGLRGDEDYLLTEPDYVQETVAAGGEYLFSIYPTPLIVDDNEGNLYLEGSNPKKYVGNIIYTHGIIIITEEIVAEYFNDYFNANLEWKSNQPIYTHNYHCKVKESEYNVSLNPTTVQNTSKVAYYNDGEIYTTTLTSNDGVLKDNVKVPEFQPYITTVGLYNDANELIAVAKVGQPIPKPANTEMTIVVKIDI